MRTIITVIVLSATCLGGLVLALVLGATALDSGLPSSIGGAAALAGLLALVVVLLEPSHRRARGVPPVARGAGARVDRDAVRVRDELRAAAAAPR